MYTGEVVTNVAGQPTLLAHGDGLNPDDRPYRAWRAVSRSRLATLALHRLPSTIGKSLAERTEARMAGMNTRYKSSGLPVDSMRALGRRAQHRGAARALVGQFHVDEAVHVPGGVDVICVPGWCERERVLLGDEHGNLRSVAAETLLAPQDPPTSG